MDAVWGGRSDGSRDGAGLGSVHGRVILGANVGHPTVINGEFMA